MAASDKTLPGPVASGRRAKPGNDRAITATRDLYALLWEELQDSAAMVRKTAVDGLIASRHDPLIGPRFDAVAARLQQDISPGVRARAEATATV